MLAAERKQRPNLTLRELWLKLSDRVPIILLYLDQWKIKTKTRMKTLTQIQYIDSFQYKSYLKKFARLSSASVFLLDSGA